MSRKQQSLTYHYEIECDSGLDVAGIVPTLRVWLVATSQNGKHTSAGYSECQHIHIQSLIDDLQALLNGAES